MIRRIALNIQYDGSEFHGWQIQPGVKTIQETIQSTLQKLSKNNVILVGSGRTDKGVHAKMQIAHTEIESKYNDFEITDKINMMLPSNIYVKEIQTVNSDFHARYSALKRAYEYKISLIKNPFLNQFRYFAFQNPDFKILKICADKIVGTNDFTFFSKNNPDTKNPICTVYESYWQIAGSELTYFVKANRFLYGMVRLLVSFQLDCATQKRDYKEFNKLLIERRRMHQSKLISPSGLFLSLVEYEDYKFSNS